MTGWQAWEFVGCVGLAAFVWGHWCGMRWCDRRWCALWKRYEDAGFIPHAKLPVHFPNRFWGKK